MTFSELEFTTSLKFEIDVILLALDRLCTFGESFFFQK